ncbi:MAG: DUF2325 domain-containing protein [Methylotenera sp.]
MSSVLIVGGDQIDGIKQVLVNYGVEHINHWSGRKAGDSNKVIPYDTEIIVLITNWISHSITHKVKRDAMKRGIKVIYTPNGSAALHNRLKNLQPDDQHSANYHYH